MKKELGLLCPGCMEESEACFCGYSPVNDNDGSLAPRTLLNERYLLGRVMSYNGESVLYMGYDIKENKKITVKEFLPKSLCSRESGKDVVCVADGGLALYKTYLSEFVDLNRAMTAHRDALCIQKARNIFAANNTAYVVFDYIEGMSFKSYLLKKNGSIPFDETMELMRPLMVSLNSVHHKGTIHRGISPATLLVNKKNEIAIIGFDISAGRSSGSLIDCWIAPGYSAPELYNAGAQQGSWTDVYALCAVLYRTLTGLEPISAPDRLRNDSMKEPRFYEKTIPPAVSKAIMHGLSLDINKRVRTINELTNLIYHRETTDDVTRDMNIDAISALAGGAGESDGFKARDFSGGRIQKPQGKQSREKVKPQKSGTGLAYALGILGSFTIIGLIMAMVWGYNTPETPVDSATTLPTQTSTQPTQTTTTQAITTTQTTRAAPTEPLYKIPDLSSRWYSVIAESYKFLEMVPEYEFHDTVAEGIIFGQDIEEGTEVVGGTEIRVKVSKGNGLIPLPDYSGKEITEYRAMLKELEIKHRSMKEFSDDVPEDYVIRCSSRIGEKIDITTDETVSIYYSKGPRFTNGQEELEAFEDF